MFRQRELKKGLTIQVTDCEELSPMEQEYNLMKKHHTYSRVLAPIFSRDHFVNCAIQFFVVFYTIFPFNVLVISLILTGFGIYPFMPASEPYRTSEVHHLHHHFLSTG